jgi:hypothetical protein
VAAMEAAAGVAADTTVVAMEAAAGVAADITAMADTMATVGIMGAVDNRSLIGCREFSSGSLNAGGNSVLLLNIGGFVYFFLHRRSPLCAMDLCSIEQTGIACAG